jgi:hypothetical protein
MIQAALILAILAALGGGYWAGYDAGQNAQADEQQKAAIAERDEALKEAEYALMQTEHKREQEAEALAQLGKDLASIRASSRNIGQQLQEALDASDLTLCPLPADVQRVRADAYQAAAESVAAANHARDRVPAD